jgi:branched-chain amino acid transport system permease protein
VLWVPEGLAGLFTRKHAMPIPLPVPPVSGPRRLTLNRVGKRFGGVEALSAVSFSVTRGEIVGLIGPNGSGKTTLLNTISGLESPDAGTITLDSERLERLPAHAISRLGIGRTFQTPLDGETRGAGLARALATGAAFLLLDEPAAGMTDRERDLLAGQLRGLRRDHGILLVDHDVELLTRVCDRLVCLDGGTVIAAGPPAEVRADPRVRASFLGVPA